jgi:predicted ATPase/DNA-binding winged helix-turn-helix (wHTH) protein
MNPGELLQLRFDTFALDEGNARLTRNGQPVSLPPKAFAVLCALARQPGQLMRKGDLLDAVWGHQHVSESVLKTTISELRAALADNAKQPRFIETASRHGYRFIGILHAGPQAALPATTPESAADVRQIVGRDLALARLRGAWGAACAGRSQVFWIAGEAGVGKTTLIDRFAGELGAGAIIYGQCVEQTGAGEPYLPILEALGTLARKDASLATLLRSVAPTWLVQLPWLCNEQERNALARELAGSGPQRMLRELAELLDRYTAHKPLLLVTEDLHWSDHATVRLIDYLARRRSPSRLMWLASFRLAEIIHEDHPLKALRHELRLHRLCEEIVLDPFSESEVADYMERRFPGLDVSEDFVRALHAHTDGLPLFVVNVIDDLVSGSSDVSGALGDARIARRSVPENLAGVIEKQAARLSPDLRAVLEAASVCGVEFRPRTVADALGRDIDTVNACCEQLARQQHWLNTAALGSQADGSLDVRYTFRHALYRNVLYQGIGAVSRAQLHRAVAQSLERDSGTASAELALHFERSHEFPAALRHYAQAAANAMRQFAPVEALGLTGRALELLPKCPEGTERLRLELALVTPRAAACTQLMGVASPEARAAFERAYALCDILPDTGLRAMELSGMGWVHFSRGEFDQARALGMRIHALSQSQGNPLLAVAACNLMGGTLTHKGELEAAREWLERGLAAIDGLGARMPDFPTVVDLEVATRGRLSHLLSHLGNVSLAREQADATLARAEAVRQPFSRMMALFYAGVVATRIDDVTRVDAMATALQKTVTDNAFVQGDPLWRWLRGWVLTSQDQLDAGYALMLEGYDLHLRINLLTGAPSVLAYTARTALRAGRIANALRHVDEGFALSQKTGERLFLPDLHLSRSRIAAATGDAATARSAARSALDEARAQHAAWSELEASVALCKLTDATADDVYALKSLCAARQDGRDTALYLEASRLIA